MLHERGCIAAETLWHIQQEDYLQLASCHSTLVYASCPHTWSWVGVMWVKLTQEMLSPLKSVGRKNSCSVNQTWLPERLGVLLWKCRQMWQWRCGSWRNGCCGLIGKRRMGKMMTKFGMSHMGMWKIWKVQFLMVWGVMCLVTDVGGVRDLPPTELSSAAPVDSSELIVSPSPLNLLRRSDFPEGFVFGTSSAAYQVCLWIPFRPWFRMSVGMPVCLGMCEGFVTLKVLYPFCTRLVCSMKEACTREVEDLVFGILALTCQVWILISTFFNVFEALPVHVSSLWESVISPQNLDLELFF